MEKFNPNDSKWTNRLSIEKKNICKKSKKEDFGYRFFVEEQKNFYCCEECGKELKLQPLF